MTDSSPDKGRSELLRAALVCYSVRNQESILTACPHATEVWTFNGWLAAGRVVVKGQKGIRLVAPDTMDDGKITSIKPVSVFDATQIQERTPCAAAWRGALWAQGWPGAVPASHPHDFGAPVSGDWLDDALDWVSLLDDAIASCAWR